MKNPETARQAAPMDIAVLGAGYVGMAAGGGSGGGGGNRRGGAAPEGVQVLAADLSAGPPAGLPERLDAIVLAVAPGGPADSYASTYPPAARAAVALARATAARSIVYTSSTGVYGGENGEWVDEQSPRNGAGPGQAALCEAEDLVLESGLPGVTVLRIAGIYGPGREICPRYARTEKLPLRGSCWVNLAHRDDIVAAMVLALQYRGSSRVLNVCDGTPAQASEIARWCATVRGEAPDALKFTCDDLPTRSNQRISNAALRELGWRPRFASFHEGGGGI